MKGFGLIEIVIVTAIVSVALFAFSQAGALSLRLLRNEKENLEMTLLAQEALEAARAVRDESWGNIAWRTEPPLASPSLPYYPEIVNGKWTLATTSPGPVDAKYSRFVIFEKASRDSSDRIVSSGGTNDPQTRKVIARAASTGRTIELVSYLTDFQSFLPRTGEAVAISYEGAATDGNLASFPSQNAGDGDPSQSFTTLASAIRVTKAALLLRRAASAPSDVYAELRAGPTGAVLGTSQTVSAVTISGTGPAWVDFRFPDPVALAALTSYTIRMRSVPDSTAALSGSSGTLNWLYTQTASSPYTGGTARRYIGRLSNPADSGQELDQYDFGFKVYALQ